MSVLNKFTAWLIAPTFVKRAYLEINKIDNKEFFLRKNIESKKIIEEILPIATFLKYFETPERQIKCRYFSSVQNYDAIIRITGIEVEQRFLDKEYFLEVTVAEQEKIEYLKREAMARYGSVFGGDNIRRIKDKKRGVNEIESKATSQDFDFPVKKAIELTRTAIQKKLNKVYPKPCILLVQVTPDRTLSFSEWAEIGEKVRDSLPQNSAFKFIFIVNWATNTVFMLKKYQDSLEK